MNFGMRIKEARKAAGLTQGELGAKIGVAKSTVAGYESGHSQPDIEKTKAIMDCLDVDANYLFQDLMQQKAPPAEAEGEKQAFIDLFDRLSQEEARKLLEYASLLLRAREAQQ